MKRNRHYKRLAIGIAGGAGLMGLGYLAAQKLKAQPAPAPKPAPVEQTGSMVAIMPPDSTNELQFAEPPSIGQRRSRANVGPSPFPILPSVQSTTPAKKRQLRQRKPQVSPSLAAIPEEKPLGFELQQQQQVPPEPAPAVVASGLLSESDMKDINKILATVTTPSKEKTPPPPPKVVAEAAPAASVLALLPAIPEPVDTAQAVVLGDASLLITPQQAAARPKLGLTPLVVPPAVPKTPPPPVQKPGDQRSPRLTRKKALQQQQAQETKQSTPKQTTQEPNPADVTETKLLLEEKQAPVFLAFPELQDLKDYGIDLGILESQIHAGKCAVFNDVTIDFKKAMGSGSFGHTYQACINNKGRKNLQGSCGYVAKFIRIESKQELRNFLLESYIAIIAGQHDIGPAVKGRFICRVENDETIKRKRNKTGVYGVIISEALVGGRGGMKMSFNSFKLLLARVQKMHREVGIVHGDLFERNILQVPSTRPTDYKIIDFGWSWLIDPKKDKQTTNLISFGEMCGLFFGDARSPEHEYKYPLIFDRDDTKQEAWNWMRNKSELHEDLQKRAFLYLTRGITFRYIFSWKTLRLNDVNMLFTQMVQNLKDDPKNHAGNFMALILHVMLPIMMEVGQVRDRAQVIYMTVTDTYTQSLDVFNEAYKEVTKAYKALKKA